MLKKIVVFLCLFSFFQFPVFSATTTRSGSGSVPEMAFRSWRVGRSPMGTDTSSKVQKSFITISETECWVSVSVGYKGGTLPRGSASPIDPSTVEWEFSDLRKGWAEAEAPGTSWSGLHPSKLSGRTSFNVLAKFSLPKYNDRTHYTISASCSANDANRRSRSPKHRSGENMKITVTFKAKTYSGQAITPLVLRLVQDEKDQLRQEYLDLTRKIPPRGSIKDVDGDFNNFGKVFYDFGHYDVMLYENLKDKHRDWKDEANKLYRKNKTQLTQSDLKVMSAFRNPHHNDHHARETTRRATDTFHGLHQYGLALDIRGRGFDIDDDGSYGDQDKMIIAAQAAGSQEEFKYTSTEHVHADWRGTGWPPSNPIPPVPEFSLPPQGTDSAVENGNTNNGNGNTQTTTNPVNADNPGNSVALHACGVHTISTSGDHSLQASCSTDTDCLSTNFYLCSHTHTYASITGACGHTYPSNESLSHRETVFPCRTHLYYVCSEPSTSETRRHHRKMLPCGEHLGRLCSASLYHTQSVSCPPENGVSCASGTYYRCASHSHSYPSSPTDNDDSGNPGDSVPPAAPTTVACGGAGYTGCSGASSRTAHHVPLCSNGCGNGCWTCSEYAYRHTDSKTCKRSGCGATLTPCQNGPSACVRPGEPDNWHWL